MTAQNRRPMLPLSVLVRASALLCILSACGGGGFSDLTRESVTSIASGTASGSSLTGAYRVTRRTTACAGTCAITVSGFAASLCDVGDSETDNAEVAQAGGTMTLEVSDTPSLYRGGVNANGSFEVGAYATQNGNTLEIIVRAEGTITAQQISGTARSRSVGQVDGANVDCYGEYTLSGPRN